MNCVSLTWFIQSYKASLKSNYNEMYHCLNNESLVYANIQYLFPVFSEMYHCLNNESLVYANIQYLFPVFGTKI